MVSAVTGDRLAVMHCPYCRSDLDLRIRCRSGLAFSLKTPAFHAHLHVIPRFADQPLAGQGIRSHLMSDANRRF